MHNIDGITFSRRKMLLNLLALPLGTAITPYVVAAEMEDLKNVIDDAINEASRLKADVISQDFSPSEKDIKLNDSILAPFSSFTTDVEMVLNDEMISRRELAKSLNRRSQDDLLRVVREEGRVVQHLAAEHDVPLVPDTSKIVIIPIPELPSESLGIILVDILIDALGIGIDRGLFRTAVEDDKRFGELMERLEGMVMTRNWEDVAKVIDSVLAYVLTMDFLNQIRKTIFEVLGAQEARRLFHRSISRLIVRFVPFVGWAYMAFSLLLAIKRHSHRF